MIKVVLLNPAHMTRRGWLNLVDAVCLLSGSRFYFEKKFLTGVVLG